MPELPDLEIICAFLSQRVVDIPIVSVQAYRPFVIRNLLGDELDTHLVGSHFVGVSRRAKFLLLPLANDTHLVINPMLAGRIRYGQPLARTRKRDVLAIVFADGRELRYHDAKDMGKLYLTRDLAQIPTFDSLGPEATSPDLTLDIFRQRFKQQRGEVKRVLTNQRFVAGIGNAYADEICWRAGIYPFRRRSSLDADQVAQLYTAMRQVLAEAIEILGRRMGENIDQEIRDFLSVHGQAGAPCPRCGSPISQVKRERRATHFCRTCQPGLMIRQ